jgi:hypothetical protein
MIMLRRFIPSLLTILALVWFANLVCQAQRLPSPKSEERQAWHASMMQTPLPGKGCFKASYPATEWQEVACTTAPNRPLAPARGAKSNTVGKGYDYVGVIVSGLVSQAEGSFVNSSNLVSSNAYSLQLNTNFFTTSACSGAADPSFCYGWQQFVFQSSGLVYMEYWLVNWGKTCPSGWTEKTVSGETDCYENSSATGTSSQPITNLPYMTLTGKAAGATDTALIDTPSGDISAVGQDSVLNLEQGWSQAEFNVFGNGNGAAVNLNSNAALVVQVSLANGTTNTPSYTTLDHTAETNNLTLIGTAPCRYGGTTPMIQFMESNDSSATASCGASGIETNIVQPPSYSIISVTPFRGEPPSLEYKMELLDGTPGAEITMIIEAVGSCPGTDVTYPSGEVFELVLPVGCSPQGYLVANAPGYLQSPIVSF